MKKKVWEIFFFSLVLISTSSQEISTETATWARHEMERKSTEVKRLKANLEELDDETDVPNADKTSQVDEATSDKDSVRLTIKTSLNRYEKEIQLLHGEVISSPGALRKKSIESYRKHIGESRASWEGRLFLSMVTLQVVMETTAALGVRYVSVSVGARSNEGCDDLAVADLLVIRMDEEVYIFSSNMDEQTFALKGPSGDTFGIYEKCDMVFGKPLQSSTLLKYLTDMPESFDACVDVLKSFEGRHFLRYEFIKRRFSVIASDSPAVSLDLWGEIEPEISKDGDVEFFKGLRLG